jgi:CheY-like chemotaxis protein
LNFRADVDPVAEIADAGSCVIASALAPAVTSIFPMQWESRGEMILLVEDETFVRQALAEALTGAGYQITTAANAAEALTACRGKYVDLLLTDVVLPGMSGCELAAEFLVMFPRAAILLTSGYTERFILKEQSAHPVEYLAKPFSIATLLERVKKVLIKNQVNAKPA